MTTSSLDRKLERVAREIAEQKAREKPMTEQEFEKGDHQIDGGVVETPKPNYQYGIFVRRMAEKKTVLVQVGPPYIVAYVKTDEVWTPLADMCNFRYVEPDEHN